MYLEKFVHTPTGRYIMSIILGIGLASLFKVVCTGQNCLVFEPPPTLEEKDIYKINDKCYNFNTVSSTCDTNTKLIKFA